MTFRRPTIATGLLLAALLGAFFTFRWQGILVPVRIAGGSMAPSLMGDHFLVNCRTCRFPCRYDASLTPRAQRVMCPNCGAVNAHRADGKLQRGQRVRIDRWAYHWRRPERWEVVAFRWQGGESSLGVKRIVGLPGEILEIRQGNLYANGRLVRKSLTQLRQVAQLVHDQRYTPDAGSAARHRWQPEAKGNWQPIPSGFQFRPLANPMAMAEGTEFEWLAYHHRLGDSEQRVSLAPLWDSYAYNQGISRRLHQVNDVLLVGHLRDFERRGQVAWEVQGGGSVFRVVVDFAGRTGTLFRNQRRVLQVDLPGQSLRCGTKFELAWCDGQLLFALGERQFFGLRKPPLEEPVAEESEPVFRIGAQGGAVAVDRLRVYRDLYYLDPVSTNRPWEAPLRLEDETYFVVGDNLPISRDSRHLGAIDGSDLVGPVQKKRFCQSPTLDTATIQRIIGHSRTECAQNPPRLGSLNFNSPPRAGRMGPLVHRFFAVGTILMAARPRCTK